MNRSAVTLGQTFEGVPAQFDVHDEHHLFISGGDTDSKMTAIRAIAQHLADIDYDVSVICPTGTADYGDVEGVAEIIEDRFGARKLLAGISKTPGGTPSQRVVILDGFAELTMALSDDYLDEDETDEMNEAGEFVLLAVRRLLQHGSKSGVHVVVSCDEIPERLRQFKSAGAHLCLGEATAEELSAIQQTSPEIDESFFSEGRGVLSSADRLVNSPIIIA